MMLRRYHTKPEPEPQMELEFDKEDQALLDEATHDDIKLPEPEVVVTPVTEPDKPAFSKSEQKRLAAGLRSRFKAVEHAIGEAVGEAVESSQN